MKLTESIIAGILKLKQQGLSSRKIAKELGVGKSSINYYLKKAKGVVGDTYKKPKILFLDLETAPTIAAVFGRFKVNVSQDGVIEEGGWLISYAYKWQDEDTVKGNVLTENEALTSNDSNLCKELWDLIEQADIVIAHNLFAFDLPVIKTRMIVNGFPPIKKVKGVDTLVLAKEFRFNSNKLDSLCRQLDIGEKVKHAGMQMWVDCLDGKTEALQDMFKYNLQDIVILEELYNYIKPHSTRHPNLSVGLGDKVRCNICCSDNVKPTGNILSTNISSFEEYTCNDCKARFKSRTSITTKEQRKNFLSN